MSSLFKVATHYRTIPEIGSVVKVFPRRDEVTHVA